MGRFPQRKWPELINHAGFAASNDEAFAPPPPSRRLRLDTLDRVRRKLVVTLAAKAGDRDVADASKLANILATIARLLEGPELHARVAALEARLGPEE